MKIGLLEVELKRDETPQFRRTQVLRTLETIKENEFDLIILPELWISGAFDYSLNACIEQETINEVIQELSFLAANRSFFIHCGTFPIINENNSLVNRAIIIGKNGKLLKFYDKMQLFGFENGEKSIFSQGNEIATCEIANFVFGISTCYDLRFPEIFIKQIQMGAKVLLVSASWPKSRISHWTSLLKARAIESQAFVIGCNSKGVNSDVILGGESIVFGPTGNQIVSEISKDLIKYELTIGEVDKIRTEFPVLRDRRSTGLFDGSSFGNSIVWQN